jgi:hypothetical protein
MVSMTKKANPLLQGDLLEQKKKKPTKHKA